jgi:SSS family solute:Na+ symporter
MSQLVVFLAGLAALAGSLFVPNALVRLSVVSYEGLAQLIPALIGGLLWRRMTMPGALAGLVVGEAIVAPLALSGHDPLIGVNVGLLALVANVLVCVAVSRAWPSAQATRSERFERQAGVSITDPASSST